jgi:hypothetical protein
MSCALFDQAQSAFAGDDFGRALGGVGVSAQHTHRVVVGQQHVFDGQVADGTDLLNQVLRHGGCGGGVAHHDEAVTNDHARVGVTLGGVGPAVLAELLESDLLFGQIGLAGEGFGWGFGHGCFSGQ